MSRVRAAAAAALCCLLIAGCQSSRAASSRPAATASPPPLAVASSPPAATASPAPAPTLAGEPPAPTAPSSVPVQLLLTGQMSGTVTAASPIACGPAAGGYALLLRFDLQGQQLELDVGMPDYRGPGSYPIPPERVSVHTVARAQPPRLYPATEGRVAVDAGQRSGTLDVSLQGDQGTIHLTGRFSCT